MLICVRRKWRTGALTEMVRLGKPGPGAGPNAHQREGVRGSVTAGDGAGAAARQCTKRGDFHRPQRVI
jgi:hypothetical protein